MTLYNFMMLDVYEQASELFENGIKVASLNHADGNYELYALSSIFIEIKRHKIFRHWVGQNRFAICGNIGRFRNDIDAARPLPVLR